MIRDKKKFIRFLVISNLIFVGVLSFIAIVMFVSEPSFSHEILFVLNKKPAFWFLYFCSYAMVGFKSLSVKSKNNTNT